MPTETHFRHTVIIDGADLAGITLAGASINYGVTRDGEAPTPANAYLTLVSADAVPNIADDYPGFTWGDRIPSGFTPEWSDRYEGGLPRINLGSPVSINAATPTGFSEAWSDTYDGGFDSTRFTGIITAIDVQPATVTITAVTAAEALTRVMLDPSGWPAETETARVNRILAAAGVTGANVQGTSTIQIAANPATETAASAWSLLSALSIACDAVVYTDRAGVITYRTRTAAPGTVTDLVPGATLLDGLTMTTEIGAVANSLTVEYGPKDARVKLAMDDAASVAAYGKRDMAVSVPFVNEADAMDKGNRVLMHYANPVWHMPRVSINLRAAEIRGAFPSYLQEILELDLDDAVNLPDLLPASPVPSYLSRVLGYREVLDPYAWTLTFALNPAGWTKP